MALGDSASTIFALVTAGVLTLAVPTVTLMNRYDNVVEENVSSIVSQFKSDITGTAVLSMDKLEDLETKLTATGNTYDIYLELWILDENPGKKTSQTNYKKIGENVYSIKYTTQILEELKSGPIILKEGDYIYIKVENQNSTAAQTAESGFFSFSNDGEVVISVDDYGMVRVNGSK